MNHCIRLLVLTNEPHAGTEYGFRAAFTSMVDAGEIEAVEVVAPRDLATRSGFPEALAAIRRRARSFRPNTILVMSPKAIPYTREWIRGLRKDADDPTILYWEGDAWDRFFKRPTRAMRAWAEAADVVYSVALGPQRDLLHRLGARRIIPIPHTYCHVQFARYEKAAQPEYATRDVVFLGTRAYRGRVIPALPGSRDRAKLVRSLQRRRDLAIGIFGMGWRGREAYGAIPFADQIRVIQSGLIVVNWDHYPRHSSYTSDRLANVMLAARPFITTRHPDSEWIPSEANGVFAERCVRDVVERLDALLSRPRDELLAIGRAAHDWVVDRLSDRQAARYMLSICDGTLAHRLPREPWALLGDEPIGERLRTVI